VVEEAVLTLVQMAVVAPRPGEAPTSKSATLRTCTQNYFLYVNGPSFSEI
jgi:hypothetical protein